MLTYQELLNQIENGEFTEFQIRNLMLSLSLRSQGQSTSKSNKKKVKLDEDTEAIMQKCRENRSEVFCCPHCGSISVVKNGTRGGRQRYRCKDCRKTFGDTFGTVLYKSKLSVEQWKKLLSYTLMNQSVRFIRKETKLNPRTILYNRHRISELVRALVENQDDFQSIAQADEYYIPLAFKDVKDPDYFIETLGRLPNTHLSRKQRYEYAEKAGYSKDMVDLFYREKEEDQDNLKDFIGKQDLKSPSKMSAALNALAQENILKVLDNLDNQQKKKRGLSYQQVCILTCVDSSQKHYLNPACLSRPEPKHIQDGIVPHLTSDTILVTDSLRAYRTVANKNKIHLRQIPSGKHSSGPFNLGLVNGYHSKLKTFMDDYRMISSKYVDNYMALFYWQEKQKRNNIPTMVDNLLGVMTMPMKPTYLHEFKYKELPFDTKKLPFADEYREYWGWRKKIDTFKMNARNQKKKEERKRKREEKERLAALEKASQQQTDLPV